MRSMTGFGRASMESDTRQYTVEIKSVNHRYNDVTIKGPRNLLYLEDKIKKCVANRVSRGKIDIYITYINIGTEGKKVIINKELAKEYIEELKDLAVQAGICSDIKVTDISRFPDVLNVQEEENGEIEQELIKCVNLALDKFIQMREQEGATIKEDLENRILKLETNIESISKASVGLVDEYVLKLEKRINEILKTDVIDKTRLAQEIVIYSDKCSIEEELIRLKSHIKQLKEFMQRNEPIGKKIDFLIQEMNREANTIGSKSVSLEITNSVVEIKTILEDIREQIQNIE